MALDFTTLSDDQIRYFLRFIHPEIIDNGKIERYILSGKCVKIKIEYHDIIMIEPEAIFYHSQTGGKAQDMLTIKDIKNCINLYNTLISSGS